MPYIVFHKGTGQASSRVFADIDDANKRQRELGEDYYVMRLEDRRLSDLDTSG